MSVASIYAVLIYFFNILLSWLKFYTLNIHIVIDHVTVILCNLFITQKTTQTTYACNHVDIDIYVFNTCVIQIKDCSER
jgi:hypothetical protein